MSRKIIDSYIYEVMWSQRNMEIIIEEMRRFKPEDLVFAKKTADWHLRNTFQEYH